MMPLRTHSEPKLRTLAPTFQSDQNPQILPTVFAYAQPTDIKLHQHEATLISAAVI